MNHNPNNVRIGDEVRFLNAVGGGRVARITFDTAWVEDEDGFEIPTPLKECVVVTGEDSFVPAPRPPKLIQDKLQPKKATERPAASPERPERGGYSQPQRLGNATKRAISPELNVYLAFLPVERSALGRTSYEAYLVNESDYTLFFTYLSAEGTDYSLRSSGMIAAGGDYFLEELAPSDLNELEQLAFQFTPFAERGRFPLQAPLLVRHRLDATRFFKLHSFKENKFFEDDALVITLVSGAKPEVQAELEPKQLEEALRTAFPQPERVQRKAKATATASAPDEPIVVDLHASELLETTAGMSNADIHEYQIAYFDRVMQQHLAHKGRRLIFIHGKGDGVLRRSIESALRLRYRGCRHQDASFREYGYGATQVTIG